MVNLLEAQKPILHWLIKMAGLRQHKVETEPGTVINFWVPIETIKNRKETELNKPVVVLVHGFAAYGIYSWQFQVGSLTKNYSVYIPDLLFFGDSFTDKKDRSPAFQAEVVINGLKKLGVEKCFVVGFSYGGMVTFKMAELYPDMVLAIVVSGSILAMNDSISDSLLSSIGYKSSSELLLPNSVKDMKALYSLATYRKFWFPDRIHRDYLEVMFTNRKERAELLEGLIINNKDMNLPKFSQKIHLLWGENDQIFRLEFAQKMKVQLGENVTIEVINNAGHLVFMERPCVYNRCLKQFLFSLREDVAQK